MHITPSKHSVSNKIQYNAVRTRQN